MVLGGNSIWVSGSVIGSSRSSLVVMWGDHGGDGGVTRSGLRYRLLSPTSSVVKEDDVIVNNKFSILPSSIAAPLIWDMDGDSGAMKGPRCYSSAMGTIKLEDFIQEFDSWCDMQMLRNARLFSPFLAWNGLFQHLEGPSMDDYHEFRRNHATKIEEWRQHWFPCYVSITHDGVASDGTTTPSVATLALGSRPRQRGCKGAGQREARESHQGLPGV
jgi:hypothetical protein